MYKSLGEVGSLYKVTENKNESIDVIHSLTPGEMHSLVTVAASEAGK